MDIHLNIDLHKTGSHHVAVITTRLWTFIPPSLNWIIKTPSPGLVTIQGGLSLMIINNLAHLVEGFITDILIGHFDNHSLTKSPETIKLEKNTWHPKMKLFKDVFQKDISSYSNYRSIEALFNLRNNFSHGRSHVEMSTKEIQSGEDSPIESMNNNYESARKYLIEKGLLTETTTSSNVEVIWKFNVAIFFFWEVKKFLFEVIDSIQFAQKNSILSELKTAYQE